MNGTAAERRYLEGYRDGMAAALAMASLALEKMRIVADGDDDTGATGCTASVPAAPDAPDAVRRRGRSHQYAQPEPDDPDAETALSEDTGRGISMDRKKAGKGSLSVATRRVTTENAPDPDFCETRKAAPEVSTVPSKGPEPKPSLVGEIRAALEGLQPKDEETALKLIRENLEVSDDTLAKLADCDPEEVAADNPVMLAFLRNLMPGAPPKRARRKLRNNP